jgi:hypothetical protein
MKKLHLLFLFIGILFSCQNEDDPDIIINIPKKEYTVESTGGISFCNPAWNQALILKKKNGCIL